MFSFFFLYHLDHIGDDCPVFNGLYDFCQIAAGGSIAGALKINSQGNLTFCDKF